MKNEGKSELGAALVSVRVAQNKWLAARAKADAAAAAAKKAQEAETAAWTDEAAAWTAYRQARAEKAKAEETK